MAGYASREGRGRRWLILFAGGFLATCLITLVVQPVARFLGFPQFDFARSLVQGFTSRDATAYSSAWWLGMIGHFLSGTIIFPLIFGLLEKRFNGERPVGVGLGFGVALWFFSQLVLLPLSGAGIFGRLTPDPAVLGFVSFNAHVLYGIVLGIAGAILAHAEREDILVESQRRAA
jgi:hypothetical protein